MAHAQVIREPLEAGMAAGAFDVVDPETSAVVDPETSAAGVTGARRGRDRSGLRA
jgi:hypothetical protein